MIKDALGPVMEKLEFYEAKAELQKKGLKVPQDLLQTIANKWIVKDNIRIEQEAK